MDFELAIIGGGPAGYVAAIRAAQKGLKVVCIESGDTLGGTCLNVGCIPSKALLHSTEVYHKLVHHGETLGVVTPSVSFSVERAMAYKESVVSGFTKGIAQLFKKNGVTHIQGHASFKDAHCLQIASKQPQEITAKYIMIATGSVPASLPFAEIDEDFICSSTGALSFREPPEDLVIVGAGVIGLELGSVWARAGSNVTVVEFLDHILPGFDADIQKATQKQLEVLGIKFYLNHKVVRVSPEKKRAAIIHNQTDRKELLVVDKMLIAAGRRPNTEGLQLDVVGITLDSRGFIPVNQVFQTAHTHIYAVGDVIGGAMLAHKAEEEAITVVDSLTGHAKPLNYAAIPGVVYIDPELANVGYTEQELKTAGIAYKKGQFNFAANSRARAIGESIGFVKMLAHETTGQLLGCHIMGKDAGELIMEAVLVMQRGGSVDELAHATHPHPALCEAVKEAAMACGGQAIHS